MASNSEAVMTYLFAVNYVEVMGAEEAARESML